MAAPQPTRPKEVRRPARPDTRGEQARSKQSPSRQTTQKLRRRRIEAGHRRFLLLVIVPVLLMLGSVYMHTVANDLQAKAADLEEKSARTKVEGEKLDVRVAELSSPGRIREMARQGLGMRDPDGADMKVLDKSGEDVARHGGEQAKEAAAR